MLRKKEIPIGWFVCPVTKEKLVWKNNKLYSSRSCFQRNIEFGFWNFIPNDLKECRNHKWAIWEKLQANGLVSYTEDPTHNLGVGYRKDYIEFGKYLDLRGKVLDVGCGPQEIPTYLEYCCKKDLIFIGIDPLIGNQPRKFRFVQGLAEYIPFNDNHFDQVLFVTSLDHFISLKEPLVEGVSVGVQVPSS